MKSLSFNTMRRFLLLFCAVAALAAPTVLRADDAPTFSDPDVTAFARDYGTFVDQYAVVMKDYMAAVKANDTGKLQAIGEKAQQFQGQAQSLQTKAATIQGKLKPEETQKFSDYMQACVKKLTDSMK